MTLDPLDFNLISLTLHCNGRSSGKLCFEDLVKHPVDVEAPPQEALQSSCTFKPVSLNIGVPTDCNSSFRVIPEVRIVVEADC